MLNTIKAKTVSGVKWTSLSMIITVVMLFIQMAVLGRYLTPEEFGVMAILMLIIGFSDIFSQFGLSEAIIQEQSTSRISLSSLYWLNLLFGVAVYFVVNSLSLVYAALHSSEIFTEYVPYVTLSFLILPLSSQFKTLFQKQLKFKVLAVSEIVSVLVGVCFAIFYAIEFKDVWALIYGYLIRCTLNSLFVFIVGLRSGLAPRVEFSLSSVKPYMNFGLNLFISNVMNFFNSRVDQLLIGSILGVTALGYYSMAFNLVIQPIIKLNPVLTKVAFPILAKLKATPDGLKDGYLKLMKGVLFLNTPLLIGLSIFAPTVIPMFIGEKWTPSVEIVQILAFYALIRSSGNAGGSMVLAAGKANLLMRWNLWMFIFQPVVIYAVASFGTVVDVAIALVFIQLVSIFIWYHKIVVKLIGNCFIEYASCFLFPLLASLPMYLINLFITSSFTSLNHISLSIISIFICGICYLCLMLYFEKTTKLFKG
ncbi:MOP flippase family protein [uncultured Shewanella sp.]|uniref:MOP flippase family protein n=1 Tax=uncultured Shewanella sp. TaxID=173975 RepID=UPI00261BB0EE|nr:MOP flippase family protein [uncultured Shewanella sp.]